MSRRGAAPRQRGTRLLTPAASCVPHRSASAGRTAAALPAATTTAAWWTSLVQGRISWSPSRCAEFCLRLRSRTRRCRTRSEPLGTFQGRGKRQQSRPEGRLLQWVTATASAGCQRLSLTQHQQDSLRPGPQRKPARKFRGARGGLSSGGRDRRRRSPQKSAPRARWSASGYGRPGGLEKGVAATSPDGSLSALPPPSPATAVTT